MELSIDIHNSPTDAWGRPVANYIRLYLPCPKTADLKFIASMEDLFKLTVITLNVCLAECDFTSAIYQKKSFNGGGLDSSCELMGIFWLTYFGEKHVEYFTRQRLSEAAEINDFSYGVIAKLSESPWDTTPEARRNAEIQLGESLFAGFESTNDFHKQKIPDTLPTIEQLREQIINPIRPE